MNQLKEKLIEIIFTILGLVSVGFVLLISGYLIVSGLPGIQKIGFWSFISGQQWASTASQPSFGILPFILSSIFGMFGAIIIGTPIAFFVSIYIAKFAKGTIKVLLNNVISILAGIPSVVYGLIGMNVLVPAIQKIFDLPDGTSLLAAIFMLAIMILPTIIKMAVTALDAVPKEFEEVSIALGATKLETYFKVTTLAAKKGLTAAIIMGVGRAIGEAMAVIMVSGNASNMPDSLFQSVRFLTTAIASEMSYSSGLQREALFSIALILFTFNLIINLVIHRILNQEKRKK